MITRQRLSADFGLETTQTYVVCGFMWIELIGSLNWILVKFETYMNLINFRWVCTHALHNTYTNTYGIR